MNSPFIPTRDYVHISHINTVLGVRGQGIPENESVNTQQLEGCPYLARTRRTSAEAIPHILRVSLNIILEDYCHLCTRIKRNKY